MLLSLSLWTTKVLSTCSSVCLLSVLSQLECEQNEAHVFICCAHCHNLALPGTYGSPTHICRLLMGTRIWHPKYVTVAWGLFWAEDNGEVGRRKLSAPYLRKSRTWFRKGFLPSRLYQEGKLITRDNSRPLLSQRGHQRNVQNNLAN